MKQIILGTAGHIDHGKTSLIKALTNIDTDRLKEEKARGITIELGFASFKLPDEQIVGIVDVPGHERFVKHMVAGVTGIDIVALVIAADEGIMPQTREHFNICELLGVKSGFIILSKIDMVDDPDWLDLVKEDISEFVSGSFLEGEPVIPVSSITGEGLELVKEEIAKKAGAIKERSHEGPFRLPIDRVFTIKGFGTVVTGSAQSGIIAEGEQVMIYPPEFQARIRGLQVHGETVKMVTAGQRTAINIQGVERDKIQRGFVLATPGSMQPNFMIDGFMRYLPDAQRPLLNRMRVRFYTGTCEVLCNVILINQEKMMPGESGFVQFRLEEPVSVLMGDRFVIRSYSPVDTIGGGEILNSSPRKHKRRYGDVTASLEEIKKGSLDNAIIFHINEHGYNGVSLSRLCMLLNSPPELLREILEKDETKDKIFKYESDGSRWISQVNLQNIKEKGLGILEDYHKKFPLKQGMPREELRSKLQFIDTRLFNAILNYMMKQEKIMVEKENVRLSSHTLTLDSKQETIKQSILKLYNKGGATPPGIKDLPEHIHEKKENIQEILSLLLIQGILKKINEDIFYHADILADIQEKFISYLKQNKEIDAKGFKELTGLSRKFTIPLLEYFDSIKLTIRVGDKRILR